MFQSLIGTLQTIELKDGEWKAQLFQSLIGTLQTKKILMTPSCGHCVSIPYRYATNKFPTPSTGRMGAVSIPYRYATNEIGTKWGIGKLYCFNPLQVRYKHLCQYLHSTRNIRFNPLQVRYKLASNFSTSAISNSFQSLIGTLQTLPCFLFHLMLSLFQSLIGTLQTAWILSHA